MAEAAAKKPADNGPRLETIALLPADIRRDTKWNSRQDYTAAEKRAVAEEPGQKMSDSQLEESIRKNGVLQPPRVTQLDDDTWALVFGYRRVRAAEKVSPSTPIVCTIHPTTGDPIEDDITIRSANLAENLHRESLKPWETAEALFNLSQAHPHLTHQAIAAQTGLSRSYVTNLIALRRKAHPQVWKQYKRWGTKISIPWLEVLKIVSLPKDRQVKAWEECLEASKPKRRFRGKQKKPGPAKLAKYLTASAYVKKSSEFRKGLKLGLSIALGKEKWPFVLKESLKGKPKPQ